MDNKVTVSFTVPPLRGELLIRLYGLLQQDESALYFEPDNLAELLDYLREFVRKEGAFMDASPTDFQMVLQKYAGHFGELVVSEP